MFVKHEISDVRHLTSIALLLVASACGGGGGGNGDIEPIGSKLSIFGLRGQEPVGLDTRVDDQIMVDGVALRADHDAAGASIATGPASMSIFFGGEAIDLGALGNEPFETTRDIIDLDAFGTINTAWAWNVDGQGGAEDTFIARVETTRDSVVYENADGRLTLRNMDSVPGSGLSYATYGYWNATFAAFDRLVAFTVADPNAGTTVPAMGGAVYQGNMTGLYSTGFGAGSVAATGDARLTASFDAGTVSGEITGITAGAESLRDVALEQTMLVGSTFSGTASTLPLGLGQNGPEMAGVYEGGLYGPLAPEAVGAFALTGAGGEVLIGGFAGQQ